MIRTYFQQHSHAWMTFDDHTVRRYILKVSGFFLQIYDGIEPIQQYEL